MSPVHVTAEVLASKRIGAFRDFVTEEIFEHRKVLQGSGDS